MSDGFLGKKLNEFITSDSSFIDSNLLSNIYFNLDETSKSFIYTDDFEYCGIFKVNSKQGIESCLKMAKNDVQKTCFLLDCEYKFSFTINYYDADDSYNSDTFDIQLWKT